MESLKALMDADELRKQKSLADLELLDHVKSTRDLSRCLRKVHDFAVHNSNTPIDEKIQFELYITIFTAELIETIENLNKQKA